MFKDVYFYRARFFPALITSIPMLVFLNKVLAIKYFDALKNVLDVLPIITHLGLSAAIIFLCVQINRLLAKEIFQRFYFREEHLMPTTNNLLWESSYYDNTIKTMIRDKIQARFGIVLLNYDEEQQNKERARKLITTAVSQIRIALKGNDMLFQHNIEYGFWRNLVGGCVLALCFSAATYFYGMSSGLSNLKVVGSILFVLYAFPIFLSKLIIENYGRYYAKIIYEQFLSL